MSVSPTSVLTAPTAWIYPQQTSCLIDDAYIRSTSPLTVVYDDDAEEGEEPIDDLLLPPSLSKSTPYFEPIKGGAATTSDRSSDKKTRVKFQSTVKIATIPSHRDYSPAMKLRLWSSMEEIRVNVVISKMRLYLDDADNQDDYQPSQHPADRRFTPLQRMQKAL